jgi:hypothetical protein
MHSSSQAVGAQRGVARTGSPERRLSIIFNTTKVAAMRAGGFVESPTLTICKKDT